MPESSFRAPSRRASRSRAGPAMVFSSHCPPPCTFRMHSTRRRGAISFKTMPRTSSRIASSISSSVSVAARITTRVLSARPFSSRSTERPLCSGILMSRTRMSGRSFKSAGTTSSPRRQRPSTSKSSSSRNSCSSPSRTIGWSSARSKRIGMSGDSLWQREADGEAGTRLARGDDQVATERGDPFLQSDRSRLELLKGGEVVRALKREPVPVICHGDEHRTGAARDVHLERGGRGVPGRVDEGFVNDSKDVVGNGCRQLVIQPLAAQLDAQTPLPLDPVAGIFQAKAQVPTRRSVGRSRLEPVDEGAQVVLLAGYGGLDLREPLSRRVRVVLEQAAAHLKL